MRRAHMRGHGGPRAGGGVIWRSVRASCPLRSVHTLSMSRASPALFLVCGSFETWLLVCLHPEG